MTDTFVTYDAGANATKPKLGIFKTSPKKKPESQAESKPAVARPEKIKIWPAPDGVPVDPEVAGAAPGLHRDKEEGPHA